ncbi:SAM-dependent methyltransferase (plasmid) [Deltaproteobacteria bacterium Smac51]|nr:SAM-dependent methyltransferase [Deltaproteobacteria bacterium Smac51]
MTVAPHPASFRDPSGFIFEKDRTFYRAVASSYEADYDRLMNSGLYEALTSKGWLIPHEEASASGLELPAGYNLVLKPERIPFISHPYEWSFSQLKEAALLTLDIQAAAMEHGLTLKDASSFNVTWHKGRPVFIDTLSFTVFKEGRPWEAYGQFCSHFLAPLALMSRRDLRLQKLMREYLGGIPLDLASMLLPRRSWLSLGCLLHIHLHARSQKKYSASKNKIKASLSKKAFGNLITGLRLMVEGFKFPQAVTEWGDYYNDTNYTSAQFQEKREVISSWIDEMKPNAVCDLGANDGTFSRLAENTASLVVAADIDPVAVELNYRRCRLDNDHVMIPLLQDLTQPSPSLGWELKERADFFSRLDVELGLALALVHHLAIGNNTPLPKVCSMLAKAAPAWIVEFPDKEDSQVQRLLLNREDIFSDYTIEVFEQSLNKYFSIVKKHQIGGSRRILYLAVRR